MIRITSKGGYRTESFLRKVTQSDIFAQLEGLAAQGVDALSSATPADTGLTGTLWSYQITRRRGYYRITWHNGNLVDGRPVAILLQYGHATGNGGYVQGQDYIMPAIRPIMDQIAAEAWKVVTNNGNR